VADHVIPIKNRLDIPHATDSRFHKILSAHLKQRGRYKEAEEMNSQPLWHAEYFQLNQSSLFKKATLEQQQEILERCSRHLLNESYFIEKSGLTYCAKMVLLAESTDIAQVYSLISADEATHLAWITPFVKAEDRLKPQGAFLQFLSKLIEECDPNTLAYVVQVILEGWGVHHYRSLAKSCRAENLRSVFQDIVKDEALHCYTGEVLFNADRCSPIQLKFIEDCLAHYTEMVRVGPQGIVSAMEEVLGSLNLSDKTILFEELNTQNESRHKLSILKNLMSQPGIENSVYQLDKQGKFSPYSAAQCAVLHQSISSVAS
jgi:rubrerythrin